MDKAQKFCNTNYNIPSSKLFTIKVTRITFIFLKIYEIWHSAANMLSFLICVLLTNIANMTCFIN